MQTFLGALAGVAIGIIVYCIYMSLKKKKNTQEE